MRKIALIALVMVFMASVVWGETIVWTNPVQYSDNTPISTADQANIRTHLFWGTSATGPWTEFIITALGAASWQGTLPAARGVQAYYTMKSELHSLMSPTFMLPPISYTIPFVAPKVGTGMTITP